MGREGARRWRDDVGRGNALSGILYLVRHGRTALNAQGRFRGRQDPPLDEFGVTQAAAAAKELAGAGVRAVYASSLRRTVQTARSIAHACGVGIVEVADLVDLDHGRWEGLTPEEAAERDPDAFLRFRSDPRRAAAPGGEGMGDVERRVLSALGSITERHPGEAIAAVSHEIPIRLVVAALDGIEGPAFWGVRLPTGSVTRLWHEAGSLTLADEVPMGGEA